MGNISADCNLLSRCSAKRTASKSPFWRKPLSQHRFFSYCACFRMRHLLCGNTGCRIRFSFLSKPHPHKEWGSMCRSCGIPDLIHIKNESHLGMDGTRGDDHGGPSGRRRAAWAGILLRSVQGWAETGSSSSSGWVSPGTKLHSIWAREEPGSQLSAQGGWSQGPSHSDAGSPRRTGAAFPERGPPKTRRPGSVQTGRKRRRQSHVSHKKTASCSD